MNILIDIGHPAHVHVFKNYYHEMVSEGHHVHFTCREKECTIDLMDKYGLPYDLLGKPFKGAIKKVAGLAIFGKRLHRVAKREQIDLFLSISSMYAAHVAAYMRKPHIVLDDTEHSRFEHMLYKPFSSLVLTPSCFEKNMGKKHVRYDGFHELAYLHPHYFFPEDRIRQDLGLASDERFALLRFVSWNAGHDIKAVGLSIDQKREIVEKLQQTCKVFISSEKELPADLEGKRISIEPHQMHQVLAAADLYIGEGASMASECAMIGTPAIYVNSLDAGTLKEQEAYGLIKGFRNYTGVLEEINSIMALPDLKKAYRKRLNTMLAEKIDVTKMLLQVTHMSASNPRELRETIWYNKMNSAA